jgi:molecular chaperone DnaJ
MMKRDFYLTLGISRTESPSGIRTAFRELVKRYHPERVGWQGARFFQDIVDAYQALSGPEKRRLYDQGLSHAEGKERGRSDVIVVDMGSRAMSDVPDVLPLLRRFETVCPPFEQLFAQVLRSFTQSEGSPEESVQSFTIQVILSPEEAARGGVAQIRAPVFYPCPTCGGSGQDWLFSCSSCAGQRMIEEDESVRIQIPPMVRDGAQVEVSMRGLGLHNLYLRLSIRVLDSREEEQ